MDSDDKSSNEQQIVNNRALSSDFAKGLDAPATQPATAQQFEEVEKRMTSFERSTVCWTRVAVCVSILAAVFICAQWYEMHTSSADTRTLAEAAKKQADKAETISINVQKAADQMERSANAAEAALNTSIAAYQLDERAWIGISDAHIDPPIAGRPITARVGFKNSGKSLAKEVAGFRFLALSANPKLRQFPKSHCSEDKRIASWAIVWPQAEVTAYINGTVECDRPLVLSQADIARINTGSLFLFLYGTNTYRDMFPGTQLHKIEFCLRYSPDVKRFEACGNHNSAD